MKFTEREMTSAVEGVAKELFAATRGPWRRRDSIAMWDALPKFEQYQRKAAVGEAVLPALLALPERPTVGETPAFTDAEYAEAAATATRALLDQRDPGAWDSLPAKKRDKLVASAAELTRSAVAAMPIRQDPDALLTGDDFVVPDSLDGLI